MAMDTEESRQSAKLLRGRTACVDVTEEMWCCVPKAFFLPFVFPIFLNLYRLILMFQSACDLCRLNARSPIHRYAGS